MSPESNEVRFVIEEVRESSKEVVTALQRLLKQLTSASTEFSAVKLDQIIKSDNSKLLITRDRQQNNRIVATLTCVTYRLLTGLNFRIEDVVVDAESRGQGIARQLMQQAIKMAGVMGADKIDLTSAPQRIAANRLYQSLGFELKKTNVYRYRDK
jgi:ribosomal protein S18 acetylase RimI-like enzyme